MTTRGAIDLGEMHARLQKMEHTVSDLSVQMKILEKQAKALDNTVAQFLADL